MSKTQKIWLAVSLFLFLVPEILWSPVWNFIYQIPQSGHGGSTYPFRENFLTVTDNTDILAVVLIVQAIGLASFIFWLMFVKQKQLFKITGFALSILFLTSIGFELLLIYSFRYWR